MLFANVHVGRVPRSMNGGRTWQPTIDIDSDVHEVRAHQANPDIVAAAATVGLCISRDPGTSGAPVKPDGSQVAVEGGMPAWIEGIADTGCIGANGSSIAIADRAGNL